MDDKRKLTSDGQPDTADNGNLVPKQQDLEENVHSALQIVDDVVLKNYFSQLHELEVVPPKISKNNLSDTVKFFKITKMVYEKDEYSTYKFASVFNSLSTINCSVFVIIDSDDKKTDFYMGIRLRDDPDHTPNSIKETLEKAMNGQFHGIETESCDDKKIKKVVERIKQGGISAVSCVANNKDADNRVNKSFIQGLEKLALSMQGETYTAVILADSTMQNQLGEMRKAYEDIYTKLSPFANTQIGYSTNDSISFSQAFTQGTSHGTSYSYNTSSTTGKTLTEGTTTSDGISEEDMGSKVVKGLVTTASMLSVVLAVPTAGMSLAVGAIASGGLGLLGSAMQKTKTHSIGLTLSKSTNTGETIGETNGSTETVNEGTTDTKGLTSGTAENLTMTRIDKSITNILERLDTQFERLKEFESLGMWECAAYFMSDIPVVANIAASTYKALMRGENSGVEASAINSWSNDKKTKDIHTYITNFMHPVFSYPTSIPTQSESIQVTPCSCVSGNELALHMGLPRRSVCGFPVIEHIDFGKEVVYYEGAENETSISIGKVFNMGSKCNNRVRLNRKSLSMHTFVTGSTGSGKSNTVYELIRLLNDKINFMVIEPAKGEYKNVFGHRSDVTVLGTNPQYSKLLQINPFKFPPNVHVYEHIDRLIEIFNVCWSMYAAMPAVLKDAVLQAYEVCGWDLRESKNRYSADFFPTFSDLQNELINVIENSAYSQEMKSNYIGALETRVKSLTNGLNGQIFSAKETDNELLFDKNVIVDLSRIGSAETKSLIMGILVMRLNEHRMAYTSGMNVELKHITILEEAHNILKRTSTEQSSEGSNVAGKSVEMLSNAIAEMRTYGEGFIIVDQSPSAVDISAIRNTNTKIIMRLPDESDRRLAGKSAALKNEQLDEIAKLPLGVAVVYQNDWLEPVLCKINEFPDKEKPYEYVPEKTEKIDEQHYKCELIKLLLKGRTVEQIEPDIEFLTRYLYEMPFSTKGKIGVLNLLDQYRNDGMLKIWSDDSFADLSETVTELICGKDAIAYIGRNGKASSSIDRSLKDIIDKYIPNIPDDRKSTISNCLMKSYSKKGSEQKKITYNWMTEKVEKGEL